VKRTLIALSLLAATLGGTTATAVPASAGTPEQITIFAFQYFPDPIEVPQGATIVVRNLDGQFFGEPHSLTGRGFNTGVFVTGTRTIIAPTEDGTYRYFCLVHGFGMNGTLIVD
jgi:plastocyanin